MRIWIWLYYKLGLRRLLNAIQRVLVEAFAEKAELPTFETPEELVDYLQEVFEYDKDSNRAPSFFDWHAGFRVFQARLNKGKIPDGDCDDYHQYSAHHLRTMKGIDKVCAVNSMYRETAETKRKDARGHVFCVYRDRRDPDHEQWKVLNYEIANIREAAGAPLQVAKQMTKSDDAVVDWAVYEGAKMKLVAIHPKAPE